MTGGLSGPAIKPVALRMVYQVAAAVRVPVVGMGGITTLSDALEFFMSGASAIQIGTAIFSQPSVLLRLIDDLTDWLTAHRWTRLADIIGSAHPVRLEPQADEPEIVNVVAAG